MWNWNRSEDRAAKKGAEHTNDGQDTSASLASSNLPTRRELLGLAAVGTVALSGRYAMSRYFNGIRQDLLEKYGDLNNPLFRAREDLKLSGTPVYRDPLQKELLLLRDSERCVQKINAFVDRSLERISEFESKFSAQENRSKPKASPSTEPQSDHALLEKSLEAKDSIDRHYARLELIKIDSSALELSMTLKDLPLHTSALSSIVEELRVAIQYDQLKAKTSGEMLDKHDTPEEFTRVLVTKLTDRPLPEDISFEIREIDRAGIAGFANQVLQQVVVEDSYYGNVVLVLAHEAGHLMAPHSEHEFIHREEALVTTKNWEEACAYAFEALAAEALQDTDLKPAALIFHFHKKALLDEFYNDIQSDECHRVGMAYFDAALTVLGSSAKAYNYLSSHRVLTPEMEAVIRDNKALVKSNTLLREQARRNVEAADARLSEVMQKTSVVW